MKKKDLLNLVLQKVANKYNKLTIAAIVLGLLMTVEVLWLLFAFNYDMRSQIDEIPINNIILAESNFTDNLDIRGELSQSYYLSNKGRQLTHAQKNSLSIKDEVKWTEILINGNNRFGDNLNFMIDNRKQDLQTEIKFKFINNAETKSVPGAIESYMLANYNHGVIDGKNFTDNKKELYISERLLDSMGLISSEVIGKTVSMDIDYDEVDVLNQRYMLDDDTISNNMHIKSYDKDAVLPNISGKIQFFKDYRIIGVISRDYYSLNNLTETDADIWIKDTALLLNSETNLFPSISLQDVYEYSSLNAKVVLTYPRLDYVEYSRELTEQGCFFPFFIGNYYTNDSRASDNLIMPLSVGYMQCGSYAETKNYAEKIERFVSENSGGVSGSFYSPGSNAFLQWRAIDNGINTVSIVLAVIGGITLLTVTLNYGNVMIFNARKRKDYLEMLRKIGLTEKEKNSIVRLEIFSIFIIAIIITFFVGLLLSALIKLIVTRVMHKFGVFAGMSIALWFFFPAMLILAVVMTCIVAAISTQLIGKR